MKKIFCISSLVILIQGCSETAPTPSLPEKAKPLSPQVKQIMGSISNIYKKNDTAKFYQVKNWSVSEFIITPHQSIQVFTNQSGNFDHVFVRQQGEQDYEVARTELLKTCGVIAGVVDAKLTPLIAQMDERLKIYEESGISAKTTLPQGQYHVMIDISRYQMMDCLIVNGDLKPIIGNFIEPPLPVRVTPHAAAEFARSLYQKIDDDEKIIRKAFKAGQYQVLTQYEQYFLTFTDQPYSEREAAKKFGQRYFPDDPVTEPYLICDRAFNELNSLAGAMVNSTKTDIAYEDAAFYARNLRHKDQLYKESKEICRQRVKLSYEQAVDAYENSDSL